MPDKKKRIDPPIWFFQFLTNDWLHLSKQVAKVDERTSFNRKLLVGLLIGLVSGLIGIIVQLL